VRRARYIPVSVGVGGFGFVLRALGMGLGVGRGRRVLGQGGIGFAGVAVFGFEVVAVVVVVVVERWGRFENVLELDFGFGIIAVRERLQAQLLAMVFHLRYYGSSDSDSMVGCVHLRTRTRSQSQAVVAEEPCVSFVESIVQQVRFSDSSLGSSLKLKQEIPQLVRDRT